MTRWTTTDRIDETTAEHTITDGRLEISTGQKRRASKVHVDGLERPPLSESEPHVRVRIVSDDAWATVELDAEQADALRDALNHALTWEDE